MTLRLCILDNDVLDPPLAAHYQSFAAMFADLFARAGRVVDLQAFNTTRGEYPARYDAFDAVLLTGSHADSFSDEPWVERLRQEVTQLLAAKKKLLGVCFGHQLLALCLGAPVGRAPQGWGVGRMEYQWHGSATAAPTAAAGLALLASHQDQVLALPPGATLLASNDFCPVAAYCLGEQVLCIQPHPEFVPDFSQRLLDKRRKVLGETLYQRASASLGQGHDGEAVARWMLDFIRPSR